MFVCLLSWTFYVCLFVKLDISWLFVCLTGLCYDFGAQKMATRWRWHPFKLKNMKFSLLFSVFWWIFAEFSMIFGISSAHFGTLTQCSVDPHSASSAYLKTSRNTLKHLRNFEKPSESLKKSHETSRKWIFFEFRPISMNFQMYQNQKQSKCVLYNSNSAKKRKYRFK